MYTPQFHLHSRLRNCLLCNPSVLAPRARPCWRLCGLAPQSARSPPRPRLPRVFVLALELYRWLLQPAPPVVIRCSFRKSSVMFLGHKGSEPDSRRCTGVIGLLPYMFSWHLRVGPWRTVWGVRSHPGSRASGASAFRSVLPCPVVWRGCRGAAEGDCLWTGQANRKVHFFTFKRNRIATVCRHCSLQPPFLLRGR